MKCVKCGKDISSRKCKYCGTVNSYEKPVHKKNKKAQIYETTLEPEDILRINSGGLYNELHEEEQEIKQTIKEYQKLDLEIKYRRYSLRLFLLARLLNVKDKEAFIKKVNMLIPIIAVSIFLLYIIIIFATC